MINIIESKKCFTHINSGSILNNATEIANNINKFISENYGYSNYYLEKIYKHYKNSRLLDVEINLDSISLLKNEISFWNQDWIKEIDSFQEFAVRRKRDDYVFT